MDIQIRRMEQNDGNNLAEIYSFESVIEQTSQLPYGSAAFWQNFYSSKDGGHLEFIAVCSHQIAGHLGILLNQNPRRKHVASFGIAVHPDLQGKGVGSALMKALIDLSDHWLNLFKIELSVFSDNEPAIRLYKKFDFTMEGESKYDTFRQGKYCHSYRMARFHPKYHDVFLLQKN